MADNKLEEKLSLIIPILMIGFFIFICAITALPGTLFFFDFAPASGSAQGYIFFQEKGGIFQRESVCWKDTPYDYCETFDPDGKKYEPGKYKMDYYCTTFVWAWEAASECKIVNATRIGEVA